MRYTIFSNAIEVKESLENSDEDAIKEFVGVNGLDLNKEKDLIRVIKHYDTF